jgi:hypothetical protein
MQFDTKVLLSAQQLQLLRNAQTITSEEYAYVAGDLVVAENVKSGEKRVLGYKAAVLAEGNKRVLKG